MTQTQTPNLEQPRFHTALEDGEVIDKSGYHQPRSGRIRCGCDLTTEKGAYRDVTVKMPDGRLIHYYHQSPVVVENQGQYRLDSHGYKTVTTKDRINQHAPVRVFQDDFEWFVGPRDDPTPFEDGMTVHE